jgi:hypothetical protein
MIDFIKEISKQLGQLSNLVSTLVTDVQQLKMFNSYLLLKKIELRKF